MDNDTDVFWMVWSPQGDSPTVGTGFSMTEAFVSTVLEVSPYGRDKSAVLYTATSCRAIMAALIKRLQAVA